MTASVLTSVVPRPAISAATAASRSNPCSIESTPPSTASRAPLRRPEWAATRAPRACTASVTRATSFAVHGDTFMSGPSM